MVPRALAAWRRYRWRLREGAARARRRSPRLATQRSGSSRSGVPRAEARVPLREPVRAEVPPVSAGSEARWRARGGGWALGPAWTSLFGVR